MKVKHKKETKHNRGTHVKNKRKNTKRGQKENIETKIIWNSKMNE